MGFLANALRGLARAVLDLDDTEVPREQLNLLSDYLWRHKFDTNARDAKELLKVLEKKHMVDGISVLAASGALLASSNGNGVEEAMTGAALYSYVSSEFPESESILVKSRGAWFMVYRSMKRIFLVKAGASLSNIELAAISREIEGFLSRQEGDKALNSVKSN